MKNYLNDLFWLQCSTILHLPLKTAKEQITNIVERIKSNEAEADDFSPQIQKCVMFYFDNISVLDNV